LGTIGGIDRIFDSRWAEELARNMAITGKISSAEALEILLAESKRYQEYPHTTEELRQIIADAYEVAREKK
jgi:hypothetical protein